ncbi:ParB/RepB/Spo0J family partition protein [Mycobacterium xenopi]|uniref:ParB/RepB/Spo0J family partition protein n=1 Tax=Mycobacterium xenopi TaxID=1789 RepID=UPI0022EAA330|nr:ParB N-terminal domain-containing protein [Mycobacterium xenopi]MDA3642189.1 ParB N-terminal domain-containing protein [Mycobacterium xenopi]MDA3660261.1 ParB N-terminal domain-containing protein [Mycobacterium xenopi]MDA3664835.1 ParB N-terminal domain-containing protein [Mycobacterium xenopi]
MGRGGVKTFDALVDAVGDNSSVDGSAHAPVVTPRSGLSRSVPLRDLVANPYNPRDSLGDLDELASIVDFQLQPVVVVTRGAFQNIYPEATIAARWVVIIGNRRLAAAQKFGRPELDVVIKDELAKDHATLLTAIISENVDRSGFDVIEEAKAVEKLVEEFGSADAAAEHLRKSKTWVSHRRALLNLTPDLQEATRRGDLAIREARSLARVPLEQQVARWNATRDRNRRDGDSNREVGKGSGQPAPASEASAPNLRSVTKALRKFDTEPNALAVALHEQLGETGARTLVTQLRKLLK